MRLPPSPANSPLTSSAPYHRISSSPFSFSSSSSSSPSTRRATKPLTYLILLAISTSAIFLFIAPEGTRDSIVGVGESANNILEQWYPSSSRLTTTEGKGVDGFEGGLVPSLGEGNVIDNGADDGVLDGVSDVFVGGNVDTTPATQQSGEGSSPELDPSEDLSLSNSNSYETSDSSRIEDSDGLSLDTILDETKPSQLGSEEKDAGGSEINQSFDAVVGGGVEGEVGELPVCKRTMVHTFTGKHGFASEYLIFLRTLLIAQRYNYTLLIDSSKWNYGSLASYFSYPEPETLPASQGGCKRPEGWLKMKRELAMGKGLRKGDVGYVEGDRSLDGRIGNGVQARHWNRALDESWAKFDHVYFSRSVDYLDAMTLSLFSSFPELTAQHSQDITELLTLLKEDPKLLPPHLPPLDPSQTLPPIFHKSFRAQSSALSKVWKLNPDMEYLIEDIERRLPLPSKPSLASLRQAKDVTVSIHVRLGDKSGEARGISPVRFTNTRSEIRKIWGSRWRRFDVQELKDGKKDRGDGLDEAKVGIYLDEAVAAVEDVLGKWRGGSGGGAGDVEGVGLEGWVGKPTIVLMSDDPSALERFTKHPKAQFFNILSTSSFPPPRLPPSKRQAAVGGGGFHEGAFNHLKLSSRLTLSRVFVRDLTFLAGKSDALIYTASSNVGRLWCMLGLGGGDGDGNEENKLRWRMETMRSVDVRWFPTARFF